MEPALLEDLRAQATRQATQKRNRPPQMSDILNPMPAATDVGYQLGIHLQGLEGTWHRLWALLSITFQFGDTPEGNADCENLRHQFEQGLGRRLASAEWSALADHAQAHAMSASRTRSPGEGG